MKKSNLPLFLFLLFSFTISTAQVKIKERVTLDPATKESIQKTQVTISDDEYWPCRPYIYTNDYDNPWQVVWINSSYPFDVAQQAFNYQANFQTHSIDTSADYSVKVVQGINKCDFIEVFEWDSVTGASPLNWGRLLPSSLDSVHGADMVGDGDEFYIQGVPDRSIIGYVKYQMIFYDEGEVTIRYTNLATMDSIDYHTLVVIPDYILSYNGVTEVPHGEKVSIYVDTDPVQCSDVWSIFNGGSLPWYSTFYAQQISGTQYGLMAYEEFYPDGQLIRMVDSSMTGIFDSYYLYYLAYGDLPGDSTYTQIQYGVTYPGVSPITANIKIVENENYPIKVEFDPQILEPGDSAMVVFMKRFGITYSDYTDFTYVPFDNLQTYNVELLEGGEYATLQSEFLQDTADCFEGIPNINYVSNSCLFLVAKDSISLDTVNIVLRVSAVPIPDGTGISAPVKKDRKDKDIGISSGQMSLESEFKSKTLRKKPYNEIESTQSDIYSTYNTIMGIGKTFITTIEPLDHFEIEIQPDTISIKDTIAFTETGTLIVHAKDWEGNDVALNPDTLLTLCVETNIDYCTLIDDNGDTLMTDPYEITDIRYQDANEGKFKIAAVNMNPETLELCSLKVYLQEDTTKLGEKEAVVLRQSLKIDMTEPFTVQPTYIGRNNIRIIAAEDSRKIFNIVTQRGSKPVDDHPFKLTTMYVEGTGGHDHTNARPDTNANFGYFTRPGSNEQVRPLFDRTDEEGRFDSLFYNASVFGDSMRICLESTRNKLLTDTVTIAEEVPDLVQLPTSNSYIKIGGTAAHHGPPGYTTDNDHWGSQELVANIIDIATIFNNDYPQLRLRINDMSLPFGGGFDIGGDWYEDVNIAHCGEHGNGHCTHRMGNNADISFDVLNQSNERISLSAVQRRDLLSIISQIVGQPFRHSDHFHLQ